MTYKVRSLIAGLAAVLLLMPLLGSFGYAEDKPEPYIRAILEKPIKLRGAKVGDPVSAKTMANSVLKDGTIIKKGTRVIGHVTMVQPKGENGVSQIGVLFDKVEMTKGSPTPVVLVLTSVAPAPKMPGADMLAYNNPASGAGKISTMSTSAGRSSNPATVLDNGLGLGGQVATSDGLQTGVSNIEEIFIVGYAAAEPGTVFGTKSGMVYIDGSSRLLLEFK